MISFYRSVLPCPKFSFPCLFAVALMISTSSASGLPPNPQREMNASTCKEAKAQLEEARTGNSLISQKENEEVVRKAMDQVEHLCNARQLKTKSKQDC